MPFFVRPTNAWRPNRELPWPSAPVPALKPFSSTNTAFRPPPRSSEPRRPQRLPFTLPLDAWYSGPCAPLLDTLFVYIRPASMRPYSVTELCAWAAVAAARPREARDRWRIFFIALVIG